MNAHHFGELRSILHAGRHQSEPCSVVRIDHMKMCADHEALCNDERLEKRIIKFFRDNFKDKQIPDYMLDYVIGFKPILNLEFHIPFDIHFQEIYGKTKRFDLMRLVNGVNFFIGDKGTNSPFMHTTSAFDDRPPGPSNYSMPATWLWSYRDDMVRDILDRNNKNGGRSNLPNLYFVEVSNDLLFEDSDFQDGSGVINNFVNGMCLHRIENDLSFCVSRHESRYRPLVKDFNFSAKRCAVLKNCTASHVHIGHFYFETDSRLSDLSIMNDSENLSVHVTLNMIYQNLEWVKTFDVATLGKIKKCSLNIRPRIGVTFGEGFVTRQLLAALNVGNGCVSIILPDQEQVRQALIKEYNDFCTRYPAHREKIHLEEQK